MGLGLGLGLGSGVGVGLEVPRATSVMAATDCGMPIAQETERALSW